MKTVCAPDNVYCLANAAYDSLTTGNLALPLIFGAVALAGAFLFRKAV